MKKSRNKTKDAVEQLNSQDQDIPIKKSRKKEMLEKTEEHFSLLKNMINAFVLFDSVFDSNGDFVSYRFRYINDAYERITGVKNEEVFGKTVHEVWPETEASWIINYGSVAMTGKPLIFDMYHKPTAKYYHCYAYRPWNSDKQFCVIFGDITESKKAEETLSTSQNLLHTVVENVPIRVFWKDAELRYLGCNLPFARDAGMSCPEDLVGKDDFQMDWHKQAELYRADDKRVMDSDTSKLNFEEKQTTPDGQTIWLRTSKVPLHNTEGKVFGILGIYDDITEYKQVEEKLRKNEKRYRELFNNISSGVAVYKAINQGNDFIFQDLNKAGEKLGDRRKDIIGRSIREVRPGIEEFGLLDVLKRVWKTGVPENFPMTFYQDDKISGWYENYVYKLPSGEVVAVFDDLSEKKKAEENLERSETKFRTLYESSSDAVMLLDEKGFFDCNEATIKIFGCHDKEEFCSKHPGNVSPDYQPCGTDSMDLANQQITTALECGTNQFEWIHKRLDTGQDFPAEVLLSKMNLDGHIALQATVRDITEKKKAETELSEVKNDWENTFDSITDMVTVHDKDFNIIRSNKAAEKILGLPLFNNASKAKCFKYYHGTESPPENCPTCECIKTGKTCSFEIFEPHLKRYLEIRAIPRFDADRNIIGLIHVVRDISEQKQANEEREKLQTQVNQSQKIESVGRLAGGVAHDFNNMLSVILGHSEMALINMEQSHPLFGKLQEIQKAAQRSANLTRQLLAFARKQTVVPKVLDLNNSLDGMLNMLRRLIGEDIELSWLPGKNLWPVKMDPSQLDQILANLCVNARDAVSVAGKITIKTENTILNATENTVHEEIPKGEYIHISLSDNGCGMDKETISNIFEPFFTTKQIGKGTGLGLATVYGIVKQNEGFINVESEPKKGTTFDIHLPRHVGKTEQILTEDVLASAPSGIETILLVEDETTILNMATEMLKNFGYRVLAADTPGKAISMAEKHSGEIHLLMTDVVMPEINGRDLAKKLMSMYPEMKRLFMSGYTANVIAHHGVLDDGIHFMQKPFSSKELADNVRKALET